MKFQRIRMLVRLLTCLLVLLAVAVQRNGSIAGHDLTSAATDGDAASPVNERDGAIVINTTSIAKDIKGYGGPVPMEITVKDGKISAIETLKNAESPEFFNRAKEGLLAQWIGTSVDDVAAKDVDAVTGATLSSNAINATVKAGVVYGLSQNPDSGNDNGSAAGGGVFTVKSIAVLLVVLSAAIVPLFVKNKRYRYVQLGLNVIVLGFWSGTFLSYEIFVNYISNGANLLRSFPVLLMLIVAFIYPYFGKKSHYCAWVCPLGSLQELAGKSVGYKLKLSPKTVKALITFQECLWFALIFVMIAGIWFEWMSYELFTAFIFRSAVIGVLVAAGIVVLLSFVVQRPYCRFICPTGCLFQITQNPDK